MQRGLISIVQISDFIAAFSILWEEVDEIEIFLPMLVMLKTLILEVLEKEVFLAGFF